MNAGVIAQCGGVPLVVQCLSSPVRNTVNYALGALYYLLCCESEGKGAGVGIREVILKDGVVELIRKYANSGGEVCVSFGNLARAILDNSEPVRLPKEVVIVNYAHISQKNAALSTEFFP
ncbi:hypothetical protein Droror1_Dr00026017 [Drosera rotundifolia]